ncbi:MAG: MarR family transcriptional regulator, partial [Parvibaculaceae bacterium]
MRTQTVGGTRPAGVEPGREQIKHRYLEALTLIERLHRRLLDVIKDD